MRLIDADAFIEYIKETSEKLEFDKFHVDSALTAKIILDGVIADLDGTSRDGFRNAPTVEPERKIIYCKDCKFAHLTTNGEVKYCDVWFPEAKMYLSADDFCSSAEKRGE